MKSVKGHTRLYERGGTYYHRTKVPPSMRDMVGKSEIKYSLKTKDKAEAVRLHHQACTRSDQLLQDARSIARGVHEERIPSHRIHSPAELILYQEFVASKLVKTEQEIRYERMDAARDGPIRWVEATAENRSRYHRATEGTFENDDGEMITMLSTGIDHLPDTHFDEDDFDNEDGGNDLLDEWQDRLREVKEALSGRTSNELLRWQALTYSRDFGWHTTDDHPQAAVITTHYLHAYLEADKVLTPYLTMENNDIAILEPPRSEAAWPLSKLLEELSDSHADEYSTETLAEFKRLCALIVEVLGDKPLGDYSKADARALNKIMRGLPSRWKVLPETKALNVKDAVELARRKPLRLLSAATIDKNYNRLGAFWRAVSKRFDLDRPINPFAEIRTTGRAKTTGEKQREPFRVEEINRLFAHPIYTGCASSHSWHTAGNQILVNDHRYWMPVLSLLTGARPGELLQLYANDVGQRGSIWYLSINTDGPDKRLKNSYSARTIPLHPLAEDLGLYDFLETKKRSGAKRLFEDAPMSNGKAGLKDNRYSEPYSKKAVRMLEAAGITRERVVFYSFRHNFEDFGRTAGIPEEYRVKLTGRKPVGTSSRYGSLENVDLTHPELSKIKFEGINFDQLKRNRSLLAD